MEVFEQQLPLPVTAAEAYDWHCRAGALQRLIPPWESVHVVDSGAGVCDGSVVKLRQRLGPMRLQWLARHHDCLPGRSFSDTQISGPFAHWEHLHDFQDQAPGRSVLTDRVEYRIPGGAGGRLLAQRFVQQKLQSMFAYRHTTTSQDLAAQVKYGQRPAWQIAITGAGGLVGSTLTPILTTGGHRVVKLVRNNPGPSDVRWDPRAERFDAAGLEGIDAIVHLAGENIAAGRWTSRRRKSIRESRVQGTRVLCAGLARMASRPRVLVCASGVGYYGDREDELLTEASGAGTGFLAELAQEWEAATEPARAAGIRVVNLRFGMVLSPRGGALAKMLLPFQCGMGGRVGDGSQHWSWISIDDAAGAIYHALMTDSLQGPVNAVAPHPVTNAIFTQALARVLGRPACVPVPAAAARLLLGEMAEELLLASTRVVPQELVRSSYDFRQPTLEEALRHLLGRTTTTSRNFRPAL